MNNKRFTLALKELNATQAKALLEIRKASYRDLKLIKRCLNLLILDRFLKKLKNKFKNKRRKNE